MPYNPKAHKLRIHRRPDGKIRWYRSYNGKRVYLATGRKSCQSTLRQAIQKVKEIDRLIASGVPAFQAIERVENSAEPLVDVASKSAPKPISDAKPASRAAPTAGSIRLAVDEFLAAKAATGSIKKGRLYILSKNLNKFVEDFPYTKVSRLSGRRGLENLTQKFKPIVKARVDAGEIAHSTASQYFQCVKQLIGWLVWKGYIDEPPQYTHPEYGLSIKVPASLREKPVVQNRDTMSDYACCILIDNCSSDLTSNAGGFKTGLRGITKQDHEQTYKVLKCCILLALNCGFTQSDCADLRMSDISLKTKTKRINRKRMKTGIHRSFLMWEETYECLKPFMKGKTEEDIILLQPNGKQLVTDTKAGTKTDVIGSRFKRYLERLDLKKGEKDIRTFRSLRKSAATYWLKWGGVEGRSYILSHRDGLVGRYYSAQDANLKRMDEISLRFYQQIASRRGQLKPATAKPRKNAKQPKGSS